MQPEITLLGPSLTVSEPIFLIAAGLFTIALTTGQAGLRLDRTYILLALYAAGLTLSAIFSAGPRVSFIKLAGEIYLIGLAVLTVNVVRGEAMLRKVTLLWLAASGICALISVLAIVFFYLGTSNFITEIALHQFGSLPPGNYPRVQGTFLYPSLLCNYMTVGLMLLFAAREMGWLGRLLFGLLLAAFAITIAFTLTPGIGGVLLAGGLWYGIVYREQGRASLANLSIAGGLLAALVFLAVSTFTVIPSSTSPWSLHIAGFQIDPSQRLLTWSDSLQTFAAHPIFGKGIGLAVADVYFMPPSGQMQLLTDAHNTLLNIAAQAGILALIPLVLICIELARRALPFDLAGENTLRAALGIAFVSAFLFQGLVGSFEDSRHLWVLIGLVIAASTGDGTDVSGSTKSTTAYS